MTMKDFLTKLLRGATHEKACVGLAGRYHFDHVRDGVIIDSWDDENLVPTEGLNFILNVLSQAATSKINTWYMGFGTGNYTVAATDTGANIVGAGRANETSAYAEAARQALVLPASTAASLTNSASKVTITANGTVTITNAFVVSTSPKADATGTLLSSLKLSVAKALVSGDQLVVTFTLAATSV